METKSEDIVYNFAETKFALSVKYLIYLRNYSTANYIMAFGEQALFWYLHQMTWFWWMFVLNGLAILGLGMKISKLEKKLEID